MFTSKDHQFSLINIMTNKLSSLTHSMRIIILYLIIYVAKYQNSVQCSLVLDQNNLKFCETQTIQPMVVIGMKPGFKDGGSLSFESTSSIPLSSNTSCQNKLRIHFAGFDSQKFMIELVKNKRLISDTYFKLARDHENRHSRHPDSSTRSLGSTDNEFYKNHLFLDLHNFTSNDDHCHYHGYVNGDLNTISAISIVEHKLLSGFFNDGRDVYYLIANGTSSSTTLSKSSDLCSFRKPGQVSPTLDFKLDELNINPPKYSTHKPEAIIRLKRSHDERNSDNYIKHDPFLSNSSSLYVELLVVHDHSQYVEYKGNTTNIAERTMQIVNIMNVFYRQLNIFIALVGVVLWKKEDEIQLTEDGDSTLTNFLKYRNEKLLPKYHHDNAQLITSTSFNGSVVGKALKGTICTHEHSGGVNTDHSHNPAIIAVTLAHELGHNFGMEHDEEDKCKCPDEKCIMSSSSSTVHPKHWSSCSINYLDESRKGGLLECLINRPEKITGPTCGNGFVEEGEDCDIGEQLPSYGTSKSRKSAKCSRGQECDTTLLINPCCDRQTCKFMGNATCAQGPCCDLSTCSVYNGTRSKICRPSYSECDFEEVCDGKSEYCPPDVYYHDGIECDRSVLFESEASTRSKAYCFNGKCANHETQCQLLWGPTGSTSKDICFEQNVHGNTSGNCGYNRPEKRYESCEMEDIACGMLHCEHSQTTNGESRRTGKLGYGFESASILTVSFFVMSNHEKIYCHGAIIDAGPGQRDPGLVPNGAYCGEDKMCHNQKCVHVADILYQDWCPSDCNGNGICDNRGVCHCHDGTIGTSCYQLFGLNFHLSLFLYMFFFFIPIVGLILFTLNYYKSKIKVWWFLKNKKHALKQKGRDPNHHRRVPYEVDREKVCISEPIPLNQQFTTTNTYDPTIDPWAETSCQSTKTPGFRLDPL